MSDSGILLQPLLAYGLWVFFMSTSCIICGNSHDTPRQSKNCQIRFRKVETEVETKEYVSALRLHMRLTFDFDASARN